MVSLATYSNRKYVTGRIVGICFQSAYSRSKQASKQTMAGTKFVTIDMYDPERLKLWKTTTRLGKVVILPHRPREDFPLTELGRVVILSHRPREDFPREAFMYIRKQRVLVLTRDLGLTSTQRGALNASCLEVHVVPAKYWILSPLQPPRPMTLNSGTCGWMIARRAFPQSTTRCLGGVEGYDRAIILQHIFSRRLFGTELQSTPGESTKTAE